MTRRRAQAWSVTATGLALFVRVTPKSASEGVEGLAETADGPALKVKVRAPPDKGKANADTETVVASWLGVAKSRVAVSTGHTSRSKTLEIAGAPAELEALIVRLCKQD